MDKMTSPKKELGVVSAHVDQLKASGAVVTLPNREKAWLPGYEVYADFKPYEDFRTRGRELLGKSIDVIEIREAIKNIKKFVSHVRATNDPWKDILSLPKKSVQVMEVIALTRAHAIGILPSGVRAEVDLEPIRQKLKSPAWQSFAIPLVGDEIAGFFQKDKVDEQNRIVNLDYTGFIQSQISIKELLSLYGQEAMPSLVEAEDITYQENETQNHDERITNWHGIENVLLVDDEKIFLYSLAEFLKDKVDNVFSCETYDDAIEKIEESGDSLDLAIVDIHVPKRENPRTDNDTEHPPIKDHLGLDIARLLRTRHRGCSVVLMTGEDVEPENKKITESKDLDISAFLPKPFGIRELYQALASGKNSPRPIADFIAGEKPQEDEHSNDAMLLKSSLSATLNSLREDIDAEGVVLFSIHPITYIVDIEASSDPFGLYKKGKPRLERSPIRDAAIRDEVIFSKDASGRQEYPKHRWLYHAYQYKSCIGLSIRLDRASPTAHALFAFHRQVGHFNDQEHMTRVRLAAREIKHFLDNRKLEEELEQIKPFELMGKLYGSMAHELTDLFSNEFLLNGLEEALKAGSPSEALRRVQTLREQNKHASEILHTFRTMAKGQQLDSAVDFYIDDILPEIISRFRPKARFSGVNLFYNVRVSGKCKIWMKKIEAELIIYNLLLNSLQQIERVKSIRDFKGEILVELSDETLDNGRRWAVIKVIDNGPGIHKKDFRRVFDIQYTTKENGCGLGLDISRKIARGVIIDGFRGELIVSRSILLAGTTFRLKLPIQ